MSRLRYLNNDGNRLIRDVTPRVCAISLFFVRPMFSTVSREILKSYSYSDSALSRPDRTLRKWDVISSGTLPILAMKSFSLSLDDQMLSSSALINCCLSVYSLHALWSLMEFIPYLRSVIVYIQLFGESFTKHVWANKNIYFLKNMLRIFKNRIYVWLFQ